MKKFNLSKYPSLPGCYIYKGEDDEILYIGKAKNLKKRISSYFNKIHLDKKTSILVSKIRAIEFIATNSEIEAFILEDSLIKKNKPPYNIDLKDSKSYAYIEITSENFPRLNVIRSDLLKQRKNNSQVYGPFVSADSREKILNTLNKTFKLRTCKKLPKRKCLRYDIGICSAPCIKKISRENYSKDVKEAEYVLSGKTSELVKKLTEEMKKQSNAKNYESALELKNKINSIFYLNEKQSVDRHKEYNEDIINYIVRGDSVYIMVFKIHKGTLWEKQDFVFEYTQDFFEEFLLRFYSENHLPKELILPEKMSETFKKFLEQKSKRILKINVPQKGKLKSLLDLIKKNIDFTYFGDVFALEELKEVLNLQELPSVIECFDVSHLSGTQVVASMVQFRNGKPDKTNYRKYKIKSFQGNNDFKAISEVISRRYKKLKEEKLNLPNLIIIDGGLGQLNSALSSLKELNLKIPIIALAKKFEEIYIPEKNLPLILPEKNKARLFLQNIRDETHRFVINFQRAQRKKYYFE